MENMILSLRAVGASPSVRVSNIILSTTRTPQMSPYDDSAALWPSTSAVCFGVFFVDGFWASKLRLRTEQKWHVLWRFGLANIFKTEQKATSEQDIQNVILLFIYIIIKSCTEHRLHVLHVWGLLWFLHAHEVLHNFLSLCVFLLNERDLWGCFKPYTHV